MQTTILSESAREKYESKTAASHPKKGGLLPESLTKSRLFSRFISYLPDPVPDDSPEDGALRHEVLIRAYTKA